MNIVLESLLFTLQLLYCCIEGIVLACLPASWSKKKNVEGETVLITGAGSGIGRLLALNFASLKCTLVLWDVNDAGNQETAKAARKFGVDVYCYTLDLSDRQAIYAAAAKVKEEVGEVDILVNNAGIVTGKKFLDSPDSLILKTMDVNTNAHYWTLKSFLPSMLERNHGHIVTIASNAGLFGITGLCDYCASKYAAVGLNESLNAELIYTGKSGVKTTVVCPYYINTGMFEGVKTKFPGLLPIVEPEYAAGKIIDAVLTNQVMLIIPRVIYLFYALKGLLPSSAGTLCMRFFGINNCMDDFKGRDKKD